MIERMNVLALDIDGVLIPSGKLSPADELVRVSADYQGSYNLSVPMARAIDELPAMKVWLTTWEDQANEAFIPVFGTLPVLHQSNRDKDHWWKPRSLVRWVKAAPADGIKVESVVWVEDEAYSHGTDMLWLMTELLGLGIAFKLIETNTTRGIQPEHLDQIRAFFAS